MSHERWDHFQEEIANWKNAIIPSHENTPQKEFDRSTEEFRELSMAVHMDDGSEDSRHEIAMEGVDVIIRMLGIITIVGGNATELLDEKIKLMQRKYNPSEIQSDLHAGMSYDQAMRNRKDRWRGKKAINANIVPLFSQNSSS